MAKSNAIQLLQAELKSNDVDIAMICETWFTSRHSDDALTIDGYVLVRKDRHKRKGGGVCFFVRNTMKHSIICCSSQISLQFEVLWLRCEYKESELCIACCYHPPKPCYNSDMPIRSLSADTESVNSCYANAIVIVVLVTLKSTVY